MEKQDFLIVCTSEKSVDSSTRSRDYLFELRRPMAAFDDSDAVVAMVPQVFPCVLENGLGEHSRPG